MLNNGKAQVDSSLGAYEIIVPSKKNCFVLIFGTLWLGGWFFGFIMATSAFSFEEDGGVDLFLAVWLTMWIIGGIVVVSMLLWGYFGKERLRFESQTVKFERTIFGVGLKKDLIRKEVKNFRFEHINLSLFGGNRWSIWGLGPGKIKFDYGLKTYSFALAVDDAEANYLVEKLNKRIEPLNQ